MAKLFRLFLEVILIVTPIISIADTYEPQKFNKFIGALNHSVKVTVVSSGPYRVTGFSKYLKAKQYPKSNCTYTSADPELIESIIHTLKKVNLKVSSIEDAYFPQLQPTVGTELYFTLKDGTEAQLLFGLEHMGYSTVDGELNYGKHFYQVPIIADRALARELFNWTKVVGKTTLSETNKNRFTPYYRIDANKNKEIYQQNVDRYRKQCKANLVNDYYRDHSKDTQVCNTPESARYHPAICLSGWK